MPLSEDEQRIINEIERSFYEHDPQFAREVSSTTLYRSAGRNLKWAALGFLAGLVVLLASFTSSLPLGVAGFLGMVASAFVFEQNLRKMGRAGFQSLSETVRQKGFPGKVNETRDKLKDRFRREEE